MTAEEQLAILVERERCAEICAAYAAQLRATATPTPPELEVQAFAADACAQAIRSGTL